MTCATISVVGIVFTQTRVGLLALLVTGAFFLSRRSRAALWFVTFFLAGFLLLGALGVNRFSPSRIGNEAVAWLDRNVPILGKVEPREWIVGAGPRLPFWDEMPPQKDRRIVPNMHVTLAWELGAGAWLITMGLILAALWRMKKAYDRLTDERMRVQLWAIMSCVVGYLVSMNGMNTFHNLPLQIFFWSLVGIGLEIVNHAPQSRPTNLIWRFGDAGD